MFLETYEIPMVFIGLLGALQRRENVASCSSEPARDLLQLLQLGASWSPHCSWNVACEDRNIQTTWVTVQDRLDLNLFNVSIWHDG